VVSVFDHLLFCLSLCSIHSRVIPFATATVNPGQSVALMLAVSTRPPELLFAVDGEVFRIATAASRVYRRTGRDWKTHSPPTFFMSCVREGGNPVPMGWGQLIGAVLHASQASAVVHTPLRLIVSPPVRLPFGPPPSRCDVGRLSVEMPLYIHWQQWVTYISIQAYQGRCTRLLTASMLRETYSQWRDISMLPIWYETA
jgi:hypothetical protein